MNSIPLLALLPVEFVPFIIVGGGLALMLGARVVARSMFILAIAMVLIPPLVEPLLILLPEWVLWLLVALVWVSVLGSIAALVMGRGARDQMVGTLAADLLKWVLFAPFRLVGWLIRALGR